MTTTWNDTPPSSPPTTDLDPCVAWGAPHDHGAGAHRTGEQPPTTAWGSGAPTPPPDRHPTTVQPARRGARGALVAVAVAGMFAAGFGANELLRTPAGSVAAPPPLAAPVSTTPLASASDDEPVAAVADALGPSVVQIRHDSSVGSGVIYDSSGLILTNAHVVDGARTLTVQLADGTKLEGEVVGGDATIDVAVVRVTTDVELPAARLATGDLRVGQLAVAVGSPFGLEESVTAGVVSAVNRPVDNKQGVVVAMIQTDAPINPGNSGGALADRRGEVIGINTMIFSQSGENNGIGFAIPIDKAKEAADALVNGGSLTRAWLGVGGAESATGEPGAVIGQIQSGSPAEEAGLERGDRVTRIDGRSVKDFGALAAALGDRAPGDVVRLELVRDGSTMTIEVTLTARPAR